MKLLSDLFPLLATLAVIALCIFTIRLWTKVGRGAVSAGSREVVRPKPVGLQQTPWELSALDRLVGGGHVGGGQRVANPNLIGTVNRLIDAATGPNGQPGLQRLQPNASVHQIATVIVQLEQQLELDPNRQTA